MTKNSRKYKGYLGSGVERLIEAKSGLWTHFYDAVVDRLGTELPQSVKGRLNKSEKAPLLDTVAIGAFYELMRLIFSISRSQPADLDRNGEISEPYQSLQSDQLVFMRVLSDPILAESLSTLANRLGFSDLGSSLIAASNQLIRSREKARFDVNAINIFSDGWSGGKIPSVIQPQNLERLRERIFSYRWCLLLAYSHLTYRQEALGIYLGILDDCNRTIRSERQEKANTKIKSELSKQLSIQKRMPKFQIEQERRSDDEVRTSKTRTTAISNELNSLSHPGWVIETMHADYAHLVDWEQVALESKVPFLPTFIMNVLGVHLLRVKFERKWHWNRDNEQWRAALKMPTKALHRLPFVAEGDTQPLKIGDKYYAFDYVFRSKPDECARHKSIKVDSFEIFDNIA